ncbi:MAG: aryldialkylphosphatase [Luteitalea sp.]|nr:aryldialkylphosphatase [Luteitalea sp.]
MSLSTVARRAGAATLCLVAIADSPLAGGQAGTPRPIPNLAGKILTVTGPIDPGDLGVTLMHEHIFIDFQNPVARAAISKATDLQLHVAPVTLQTLSDIRHRGVPNRDNLYLTNLRQAIDEVLEFKHRGGRAIVDTTSIGLGRDPLALVQVANATGLQIVMGAGWYQKQFHPPDMDRRTVEELTDVIVRDITVGAEGTPIRSGIIGEVGVNGDPLTDNELKSVRAAARASRLTGAAVTFHRGGTGEEKFRVLDAMAAEGADLGRVIMGHSNSIAVDFPLMKRLLDRGVFLQFDTLGRPRTALGGADDFKVARGIAELVKAGYADRITLSQDVCNKIHQKAYGGFGFSYVVEHFLPVLRDLGVSNDDIRKLMVENPRRALAFVAPRPGTAPATAAARP